MHHPFHPTKLLLLAVLAACGQKTPTSAETVATADLEPLGDSGVRGEVKFTAKEPNRVQVEVTLSGLPPGLHGIHIHEFGNCTAPDGSSAGEHFNPRHTSHGGPATAPHHAGDLGNLRADDQGRATLTLVSGDFTLDEGERGIVGRSVIVHAGADDLRTDPAGGSGARVACGVIRAAAR